VKELMMIISAFAIYSHVEAMEYGAAHLLAGGMVLFSFVVLLGLYFAGGRFPKVVK
jgi:molybdate transport system permease protein